MLWIFLSFIFHTFSTNLDISTVHVIFANHLDVGYPIFLFLLSIFIFGNFFSFNAHNDNNETGLAIDVINRYFDVYFPQALDLAVTIPQQPGNKKYIYTSHSWLISIYLNCTPFQALFPFGPIHCPSEANVTRMKNAIRNGNFVWHAFPFNAQLSLMDSRSIKSAIQIGHDLDKMFGKVKIYLFLRIDSFFYLYTY